ncbi:MAG: PQQ-binding-like beta-propeller repeat protein [Spirochaetales bacterium]
MRTRGSLWLLILVFVMVHPWALPSETPPKPLIEPEWRWRFVTGGEMLGPGAFGSGNVHYFASEDRFLYAVDPDGVMVWRTNLGRQSTGSVAIGPNDAIYVVLENGEIVSLNRDGRLIWRLAPTGAALHPPVILEAGYIVLADVSGVLVMVTQHGREVWRTDLGTSLPAAPIVSGSGQIIAASSDGFVHSLTLEGRPLKRQFIGEEASILAAGRDRIYLGSATGRVVALGSDLLPEWRADVGSAVQTLVIGTAGDIWVTSDNQSLSRVTTRGEVAFRLPDAATVSPIASSGALVAAPGGRILLVSSAGDVLETRSVGGSIRRLVISPSGLLIASTREWVTYAFGSSLPSVGEWPAERAGIERAGVPEGVRVGRPTGAGAATTTTQIMLEARLVSRDPQAQIAVMNQLQDRVRARDDLGSSYFFTLDLAERAAGSPYFGPLSQSGPISAPREARVSAIEILAAVGDRESAMLLSRLLEYERDEALQVTILSALGRLGVPLDEILVQRLDTLVSRDLTDGASDRLGRGIIQLVRDLDRFHGRYISPTIADVLVRIATSNYGSDIRRSALTTLRNLAGAPPL